MTGVKTMFVAPNTDDGSAAMLQVAWLMSASKQPMSIAGPCTRALPKRSAAPAVAPATGLAAIIALMRLGVRTFWAAGVVTPPRLKVSEAAPVTALVLLCVLLTVQAGTVFDYLGRTVDGLARNADYAARVLGEPPVLRAPAAEGARCDAGCPPRSCRRACC